jgi:hypothetical protein
MSQEIETKEKKEIYPGSPMTRTSTVEVPLEAHKTTKEIPYQVLEIVQNIYTSALPSQDELSHPPQEGLVKRKMHIIDEIMNMSTKKLEKLIKIVKDYSVTESQPWEIIDFVQAVKALTIDRWEAILEKVKIEEEPGPEDTIEDKLYGIISGVRTMKKEGFEKCKTLLMGSSSFRTEADKLIQVEALTKVRSLKKEEFAALVEKVKNPSVPITLTAESKNEVEKVYKQLRQLTIEQVDEVFKMVKDSSVT